MEGQRPRDKACFMIQKSAEAERYKPGALKRIFSFGMIEKRRLLTTVFFTHFLGKVILYLDVCLPILVWRHMIFFCKEFIKKGPVSISKCITDIGNTECGMNQHLSRFGQHK